VKGKFLGLGVCAIAVLMGAYEFVGIADGAGGVPTISRLVQGLRDLGTVFTVMAYGIAAVFVTALVVLARWLWPHLTKEERSNL
jgi:hypothetical protein